MPNGRDHRQKRLLELRTAFHSPAFEKTQARVAMDSDSDMCCSEGDDGIHSESADDTDETSFDSLETDTVTYKYLQSEEVAGQIDDLLDGLVAVTSVNHLFLKNIMLLPGCLLGRLTIIRSVEFDICKLVDFIICLFTGISVVRRFQMPRKTSSICLRHYNWDKNRLLEHFTEMDSDEFYKQAGVINRKVVATNTRRSRSTECGICSDTFPTIVSMLIRMDCEIEALARNCQTKRKLSYYFPHSMIFSDYRT